jgi:hypothetical protein
MIWGGICPSSEESRRAQRSRIDRPPQAARASAARVLDGEQGRDTSGDLTPSRGCPFVPFYRYDDAWRSVIGAGAGAAQR